MKLELKEKGRKNLPKEFLDALEELKLSAKNTKEKVDKVKAVGKKYDIPKELVDDQITRVLKAQGFSRWTIKRQINGSNMHHIDSKKVPEQARAKSMQKVNSEESENSDISEEDDRREQVHGKFEGDIKEYLPEDFPKYTHARLEKLCTLS